MQLAPLFSETSRRFGIPILAPVLENRAVSGSMIGLIMLHFILVFLDLPGWTCPVRETLGIPCPGCGLSRAIVALIQGDWQSSLLYHLFAPIFLIGFVLMVITMLLPPPARSHLLERVARLEARTGITGILLSGLVFYWLIRLLFFREAFITLVIK